MAVAKTKLTPVDVEARKNLDFKAGDTIRVWSKIIDEKGKARLQAFEGIVLARKHGAEIGATFTVRKVASSVGVERIFPLFSPSIDRIEVTKKSRARRSKLYYIRTKAVKDVRRKMRSVAMQDIDEKETDKAVVDKSEEKTTE
jgi:large subunit ribosomal protein L19